MICNSNILLALEYRQAEHKRVVFWFLNVELCMFVELWRKIVWDDFI